MIDGTQPAREPMRLPDLPALIGTDAGDDAPRVASRPDFSVHDEPTVVGQIPAAALEAERRYAQRTVPPPTNEPAALASKPALPEHESPASVRSERVLPPYTSQPARLTPTTRTAPSSRVSPPLSRGAALPLANDLQPLLDPNRKRTTYLLVALATVLVTAVIIVIAMR